MYSIYPSLILDFNLHDGCERRYRFDVYRVYEIDITHLAHHLSH